LLLFFHYEELRIIRSINIGAAALASSGGVSEIGLTVLIEVAS